MREIIRHNLENRSELIKKIVESNGDYRLFCIDVDDVVYNLADKVEEVLEKIDSRATRKFRAWAATQGTVDEETYRKKSYAILNAILEELTYVDVNLENESITKRNYKRIDYEKLYVDENLFPGVIENINYLLQNRRENDFYIFLSHYNPEREAEIKTKKWYELFPTIDAVETLPFHTERGGKIFNVKALWLKETYGLENLNNCWIIDNDFTNCRDFKRSGGRYMHFLSKGFDGSHTLVDHLSKLTSLNPYDIQFAISFIEYCAENPEYSDELLASDEEPKILKL